VLGTRWFSDQLFLSVAFASVFLTSVLASSQAAGLRRRRSRCRRPPVQQSPLALGVWSQQPASDLDLQGAVFVVAALRLVITLE